MKKSLLFLLIISWELTSYGQFTDNFSDGDFTNSPRWSGALDDFVVNGSNTLQLMATGAGESYLVTASSAIEDASWEVLVFMDFGTSGSNYTKVYLVSDQTDVTGALNGYYVLIGETEDEISLFRQDGTSDVVIIDGVDKLIDTNPVNVRIKVTRDTNGLWELSHDTAGGITFTSVGTSLDATYTSSQFFGVNCIYTSTRSDKFFFDDFIVTGSEFTDNIPPMVEYAVAISPNEVDVKFNEPLEQTSAENFANYMLDLGVTISGAVVDASDASLIHLTTTNLTNGETYTLTVTNVADEVGNPIASSSNTEFTYLVLSIASFRDIQINEFLADPTPAIALPENDFVELYNPTLNYYTLENWKIGDAVGQSSPLDDFVLAPDSYVIICTTSDVLDFEPFGDVIGVSSFPNFNSSSADAVVLIDPLGVEIDRVAYSGDDIPDDGITLEQVNPSLTCSGIFNFLPSLDSRGGTPATVNSVLMAVPDHFGPNLILANAISEDSLRLDFDEIIAPTTVPLGNVSFQPFLEVEAVYALVDYPKSVFVKLTESIQPNIQIQVTVSGFTDCSGNGVRQATLSFLLGIEPEADDIFLSEVLFNPRINGSDFVEIYNPSATESFELRGWKLARITEGVVNDEEEIASEGLLISPRQFLVFTNDAEDIAIQYPMGNSEVYVELSGFPSYNNDEGTVALISSEGVIAQQFDYQEEYHYELLEDVDGVSLERVSYDQEVNDANNWRSAASTVGFATPGRINSQSAEIGAGVGEIKIEPRVFIPGNSGTGRDFTLINYSFNQGGQFANIIIYDQSGRQVKELANGVSLSTSGFFRWDGTTDGGSTARMGYHVVVFEIFDGNGNKKILKKTVVVGRDF